MNICPTQALADAFVLLLSDTERALSYGKPECASDPLVVFLKDFRLKRINPIQQRSARMMEGRYVLALVGLTNTGKSTLAEALLGNPVAPRRNGPATSIPVEYEHGPEWLIKTCRRDTLEVFTTPLDTAQHVAAFLEKNVVNIEPREAKKIERITVRGPMAAIQGGIVFADTPGFGAADIVGSACSDEQRIENYVANNVHEVLFCVNSANFTVKGEECKFFEHFDELCTTVVVTKWDCDPLNREAEICAYKARFSHLFPLCRFMFIEAKWAIDAQARGDTIKLADSGSNDLHRFILERATREGRETLLHQQCLDAWHDLLELVREPLQKSRLHAVPWRVDGIHRLGRAAKHLSLSLPNLT
ncbi:MAG: dynamin family protein [Verrucomicrobia bacterium]|nr:dynamin family protein [Verrucomicrobiota bacterium]